MKNIKTLFLPLLISLSLCFSAFSQTENMKMNERFEYIMKKSGRFKEYKVIPIKDLNTLFALVLDSISNDKADISNLASQITLQQSQVDSLNSYITTQSAELKASNELNNSISFLGVSFEKSTYNILVWGLIFLMIAGLVFVYLLFQRSNHITRTKQKELKEISVAFETYKSKSHERQVKLKRDLQTAMNTLHEKGIPV